MAIQAKKLIFLAQAVGAAKGQNGGTMIMALMIMAILSIIGISVTNTSVTELQITGNIQASNMAMYDADAGVQYTLAMLKPDLRDIFSNQPTNQSPSSFTVSGFSFTITPENWPWSGSGPHNFISKGSTAYGMSTRDAEFEIQVTLTISDPPHPAFMVGMLSEADITLTGMNEAGCGFDSSGVLITDCDVLIHSNSDVTVNNGDIWGSLSASGTVGGNAHSEGGNINGADEMEVPAITTELFNGWRSAIQAGDYGLYKNITNDIPNNNKYPNSITNEAIYLGTTGVSLEGHVENSIIFVDGDVELKQNTNFSNNSTIIATGKVTIKGTSNFSGNIIAGGTIEFNGGSSSTGLLWSNGEVILNGTNDYTGSIVAHGEISHNGGVDFIRFLDEDNEFIPRRYIFSKISWADKKLL